MVSNFARVVEFHERFDAVPGPLVELLARRKAFLLEEAHEVAEAMDALAEHPDDKTLKMAVAKELADVLCVAYGALYQLGIDGDEAFAAVWRSNMTKTPNHGGKAIKGPGYVPAQMEEVV